MSGWSVIAAVDIWNFRIRTWIAMLEDDREFPHILWIWTSFSNWTRKWSVVSLKDLISDIEKTLEETETISWIPIQSVYISISNNQIEASNTRWVIAVTKQDITDSEVQRVLEAAQAVSLPQNRYVLDVIPRSYKIDNQDNIPNPIGMWWVRLEVDAQIITAPEQSIKNLEKAIHEVGVGVAKFVPATIASSESVLTRRQKELGVVNIDIWASSIWISVFEEWTTIYCWSIPVWWENVTNDIAICLRTTIETAEKIKLEYWTVADEWISEREQIDLSTLSDIDTDKVSRKMLASIMRARYEEMFYMAKNELKLIHKDWMLPAWVVLSWWGSKTPWLVDLCKEILSLPAQIWFPCEITSVIDKIEDPEYATLTWLIKFGARYWWWVTTSRVNLWNIFGGFFSWIKNLLPHG